nr:berberine bridge enzyme-like 8 isoform X2 [Coffea arabica]XP_027099589.1 berberine bridge enzyme-like 8 isoform X2 [Coffea arabica]
MSNILGFPAGLCPIVGVGGHISGGGYGSLLQRYCLMVDNVLDAQIIDVNSQVLDRKAMGEDLFGAIRVFNVQKTEAENAPDVLYKWQNIADKIDNDLFISVIVQPITRKVKGQKIIRLTFMGHFLGDANRLISVMNTGFP